MSVFDSLVGQDEAVTTIKKAVTAAQNRSSNQDMTHAWLFTGPPGSGRSNLAKAFAAALVCKAGGCGECNSCITVAAGSHPDVEILDVSGLSIKIDEIREIVSRSAWGAATSDWRVVVIEDCDRMTEAAANALLKALEEPGAQTIWLLCAPTLHDVLPTIRSRCRHISLKTPTTKEIYNYLIKEMGANPEAAQLAASISQGHIGKARAAIQSNEFKSWRTKSFNIFLGIKSEASAIRAAGNLISLAEERAELRLQQGNEKEESELRAALSSGTRGLVSGGAKAIKDLEKEQKARLTRTIRDEIDNSLIDYASFMRDCLAADEEIINLDLVDEIRDFRGRYSPEQIARLALRLQEVRELLATNASQTLLLESLFTEVAASGRGN